MGVVFYKKPTFWVIVVALIVCIAVAVGFLTDPKMEENSDVLNSLEEDVQSDGLELEGDSTSLSKWLPEINEIESIDMVTGSVSDYPLMKNITKESDIEMLTKMLQSIEVKRVADESECNLFGVMADYFFINLDNGETIKLCLYGRNIMGWNDRIYLVDFGDMSILFREDNALWSQLDYMELVIGSCGLNELSMSNGKNKILGIKYSFMVDSYTGIKEDFFTIKIFTDGTYTYEESTYGNYSGYGEWSIENDELILIENKGTENERVNYFSFRSDYLLFVKEKSDNFSYINVADKQRFNGEALLEYAE